jgi:hypothetical protein
MRTLFITVSLLFLALSGCGEKTAEKEPAKAPSAPAPAPVQKAKVVKTQKAKTAKRPAAHAGSQPTSMPASMPVRPGALPPGHPPTSQPAGSQPTKGGTLTGKITLIEALKDKVKKGSVLFIIVRRDEGEGRRGMMLAAKKVPVTGAAQFPMTYVVTPLDVMMKGTTLAGPVRIEARIDQDGDAISKQPGDLVGVLAQGAKVGQKGLDFALDNTL